MAQKKFDGVVEAVRYTPEGMIALVRVYDRRGPTFSDHVLLTRDEFVTRLKSGLIFYTGERKQYLASTFEIQNPVKLIGKAGQEFVATEPANGSARDSLQGVPLF